MYLISFLINLFYCIKSSLNSDHFLRSCYLWWSLNSRKSPYVNRLEFDFPNDWKDCEESGILPRDSHFVIEKPSKEKREDIFVYGINSRNQRFSLEIIWTPPINSENGYIWTKFFFQDNETCYLYTAAEKVYVNENEAYRVGICETIEGNGTKSHKFLDATMLIKPSFEVFDHGLIHEPSFLHSQLCQQSIFDENPSLPDTYDVGVQIRSNIIIDHGLEQEIHMFGHRGKLYRDIHDPKFSSLKVTRLFGYSPKKGYHFSLSNTCDEERCIDIINGCASWGIQIVYPIQQTAFCSNSLDQDEFGFTIKTQFREYSIEAGRKENKNSRFRSISIDQVSGWSFTISHPFELPNSDDFLELYYFDRILPKVNRLVLTVNDHDCLNSTLTGGKGSSLAKLNQIKDLANEENGGRCCFSIAEALVITNFAQKMFLESANVADKINSLRKTIERNKSEKICGELVRYIEEQKLPHHLKRIISIKMNEYFGPTWRTEKFAVRSSAAGEDSEGTSCAGQMETFLGVRGEENIYKSVVKCWASQYRFIAVQYKRNNGLPIASEMAVIIQKLIECDKAGILFTCDPVKGNLNEMLITANYGLGESVVSSISEPDNIRVKLDIDRKGSLFISGINEVVIGSKEKIVTTEEYGQGSQIVDNKRRESCCISKEEVLKLGKVCLEISRFYRGSCDFEWGMKYSNDSQPQIYIFQCRPVTSINAPSDWQLIHELDSAHPSENECLTTANVGEVYPGASSHVCISLQIPLGFLGFMKRFKFAVGSFKLIPYLSRGCFICRNNVFVCIKDGLLIRYDQDPRKENFMTMGMEYSLLGHRMDDMEVKLDSYERLTTGPRIPFWRCLISCSQMLFPVYWRVKRYQKEPIDFNFKDIQKNETSHQLFSTLLRKSCGKLCEATDLHLCSTYASSLLNSFLISLLSIRDDRHLFTDFSLLLSSCEKFASARIPDSLRDIAEFMLPSKEKFSLMSDQQALQYLIDPSNPVHVKYKKFMEENGHRGLRECDWAGKIWRKNPAAILQSLRVLLQTDCSSYGTSWKIDDDEIIRQLKTPLPDKLKFLLKRVVLPLARVFVGTREESKNILVWTIDQQRKVFDSVAQMCVSENLLPDADLLYHMTVMEIFQLTGGQKSNPQLVSMAKRRKKLLSAIEEYVYPLFVYGPLVEPSSRDEEDFSNIQIKSSEIINGTVVSRGKTKGKVYVARNMEEIGKIQAGDILVTYSTDVGWSPLFPIIGGLITEICGLISHGAVVAREFGLPCVVGVQRATQIFKTGETISLDADNGIIMKISG